MKLRIFSDVHREVSRYYKKPEWEPTRLDNDKDTVLVLAGDIDKGKNLTKFVERMADRFASVVYVLGNHEFYGGNVDKKGHFMTDRSNTFLLDNSSVTLGDVEFLGTTLWTDLNNANPLVIMGASSSQMNDFSQIRERVSYKDEFKWPKLTAQKWLAMNRDARIFLKENIVPEKKQVVITHHVPAYHFATGNPHAGNWYDAFYYNNGLEEYILDAGFWVFGHSHFKVDQTLSDARIYSNPRGYFADLVDGFQEEEVIEI